MHTQVHSERPDWAQRVESLRRRLGLSQTALGKKLEVSAMAVSRWERGMQQPPGSCYIRLGNMAGDPECWYFWGRAGLHSSDLMRVLPAVRGRMRRSSLPHFEIVVAGAGKKIPKKSQLVALPLLQVSAATHGQNGDSVPDLDQVPADEIIAAPHTWCPNPAQTSCLRVKGDSMVPLIHDGYIVAVDTWENDRSKLRGKLVITWHHDKGLIVSRLQAFDGTEVLVPENREYESITISADRGWRIIAKILWWIGKAP